jgi:hypothetical protein
MVVALFVPSCVVVVDAGWKKKDRASEKGKAEMLFEVTTPRVGNKAEFGSPPKFLLHVLESHLC